MDSSAGESDEEGLESSEDDESDKKELRKYTGLAARGLIWAAGSAT